MIRLRFVVPPFWSIKYLLAKRKFSLLLVLVLDDGPIFFPLAAAGCFLVVVERLKGRGGGTIQYHNTTTITGWYYRYLVPVPGTYQQYWCHYRRW